MVANQSDASRSSRRLINLMVLSAIAASPATAIPYPAISEVLNAADDGATGRQGSHRIGALPARDESTHFAQGSAVYFEAFQVQWGAMNMMAVMSDSTTKLIDSEVAQRSNRSRRRNPPVPSQRKVFHVIPNMQSARLPARNRMPPRTNIMGLTRCWVPMQPSTVDEFNGRAAWLTELSEGNVRHWLSQARYVSIHAANPKHCP